MQVVDTGLESVSKLEYLSQEIEVAARAQRACHIFERIVITRPKEGVISNC